MSVNPSWSQVYLPVTAGSVSACNQNAFIVHANGQSGSFYYGHNGLWSHFSIPSNVNFAGFSGAEDNTILAYAQDGSAYINIYGFWYPVYTNAAVGAATGGASAYLVAEDGGKIRKYENGSIYTVSIYGGPTKLSVTSNLSEMWGVDNAGTVYRWSNVSHSWGEITGMKLKEIHVSRSTGGYLQVMGVNTDDFGVMYDCTSATWQPVPGPTPDGKFVTLEGGENTMWAYLPNGSVYKGFF